jgi:hypothetical protein
MDCFANNSVAQVPDLKFPHLAAAGLWYQLRSRRRRAIRSIPQAGREASRDLSELAGAHINGTDPIKSRSGATSTLQFLKAIKEMFARDNMLKRDRELHCTAPAPLITLPRPVKPFCGIRW